LVGVPRLPEDERQGREERIKEQKREYNARPEVIEHRKKSQARYNMRLKSKFEES